jgi:hypothetical protein
MPIKKITCLKGMFGGDDKLLYRKFMNAIHALRYNLKAVDFYRDSRFYADPTIVFIYYLDGKRHETKEVVIENKIPKNIPYKESVMWFYSSIVTELINRAEFYDYRDEIQRFLSLNFCLEDIVSEISSKSKKCLKYKYDGESELLTIELIKNKAKLFVVIEIPIGSILEAIKRLKVKNNDFDFIDLSMLKDGYLFDLCIDLKNIRVEAIFTDCSPKFNSDFIKILLIDENGREVSIVPTITLRQT